MTTLSGHLSKDDSCWGKRMCFSLILTHAKLFIIIRSHLVWNRGSRRRPGTPQFFRTKKTSVCLTNARDLPLMIALDSVLDLHSLRSKPTCVLISLQFCKQCTRQVKGPWRVLCELKKPFKGQTRGSYWEEWNKAFPWRGVITARQINNSLLVCPS